MSKLFSLEDIDPIKQDLETKSETVIEEEDLDIETSLEEYINSTMPLLNMAVEAISDNLGKISIVTLLS